MDETVVGAAPARWTTAGMKREDEMQGSRSEAVDERGRSLVMDGGIDVSALAWWRKTAERRRGGRERATGGEGFSDRWWRGRWSINAYLSWDLQRH